MTKTERKWKDVSEELPLPCQEVLVRLKNGETIRAYRLPGNRDDPCWLNLQEEHIEGKVEQWSEEKGGVVNV